MNVSTPLNEGRQTLGSSDVRIPVIAESFTVDKDVVEVGALRVHKQIHEDRQEIQTPVFRDVVTTRRVEIGRVVDTLQQPYPDGDDWVVPIYEEVLVKQLVLTAELRIERRRDQRLAENTVVLRKEEVNAERLDVETGIWTPVAIVP